jgi:hypothetical protein
MPKPLMDAARSLTDVLRRENDALAAMDVGLAAALLAEKTAAINNLTKAREAFDQVPQEDMAPIAQSLDRLVSLNRDLLKRALAAQQRVIGIVVRAAATVTAETSYGTEGCLVRSRGPMTFSTRA